jgi:hypothetical protein
MKKLGISRPVSENEKQVVECREGEVAASG